MGDVLVEAGHYPEPAVLGLCRNWLWSSVTVSQLCALDNLSQANLAAESREPRVLLNCWAQKSEEVAGVTWWCPEHLLERSRR